MNRVAPGMPFKDEIVTAVDRLSNELIATSRFLHLHPELAY